MRVTSAPRLAAFTLLVLVLPLGGGLCEEDHCVTDDDAVVEVGTGFGAFEPLPESLPITFGLQGGFHLDGALRIKGVFFEPLGLLGDNTTRMPVVSFTSVDAEGVVVGGYEDLQIEFRYEDDDDTSVGIRSPEPVIFLVPDASIYDGQPLTLNATVTDFCGRSASASAEVVAKLPP